MWQALAWVAAQLAGSLVQTSSPSGSPAAAGEPYTQAGADASTLASHGAWLRAYGSADEDALAGLLRDDFTIVASSGAFAGKAELIQQAKKPPIPLIMEPSEYSVRRNGPVAIVTAKVTEKRGDARLEFRVTDVMVRGTKEWQLASSHWTRTAGDLTEVTLPYASLDRMTGTYLTPRGIKLEVVRNGNRLLMVEPGGQRTEYTALSPTQFAGPGGRIRWLFIAEADGSIGHAVVANLNALTPLTRVPKTGGQKR